MSVWEKTQPDFAIGTKQKRPQISIRFSQFYSKTKKDSIYIDFDNFQSQIKTTSFFFFTLSYNVDIFLSEEK